MPMEKGDSGRAGDRVGDGEVARGVDAEAVHDQVGRGVVASPAVDGDGDGGLVVGHAIAGAAVRTSIEVTLEPSVYDCWSNWIDWLPTLTLSDVPVAKT